MSLHLINFNISLMKKIIFIFFIFVFIGCNPNTTNKSVQKANNQYRFSFKTIESDYEKYAKYSILLPAHGMKEKFYPHNGEIYIEYRISYKDSSTFYISNDIWNMSQVNARHLLEIGVNGYNKKAIVDTISYEGIQKNKRVWKEILLGEIVVGFSNVPKSRKLEFEKGLNSVEKLQ